MFILTPARPTYPEGAPVPEAWFTTGKYRTVARGELEKRCAQCREYMPATSEFWHKCSTSRDGRHDWCKFCVAEKDRERTKDRITIAAAALIVFGGYCAVSSDAPVIYPLDARIAQVAR
jgi:hypothetical protein